jgi:glycosyltransferase involved in cell wall biosynthesis
VDARHVLLVSRCLPYPLHEGDRLIVHHLVRTLSARGHRVDMIALDLDGGQAQDVARAREMVGRLDVVRERRRSPLDYLVRLARPFPRTARQTWHPPVWEALSRRVAEHRPDVVHFFGGVQVYEHRDAASGRPRIIVPYESYALRLERAHAGAVSAGERLRARARLALARRYERTIYRGFDRVVVLAEADRAALAALAPGLPVRVVPNGVDVDYFRPAGPPPGPPVLTLHGNYAYGPNVDAALCLAREVLPRVRAVVPSARVSIVGPGAPAPLRAVAGPDVEITGWVGDVRPFLARAACLVAPIRQGAGMRNKLLEAFAAGVPVVATPLACDGIAVTPGEDVLQGDTPQDLAAAAVAVIRDPDLRARLARGGRRLVEAAYTWAHVAAAYEALYAEVAGGPRARVG